MDQRPVGSVVRFEIDAGSLRAASTSRCPSVRAAPAGRIAAGDRLLVGRRRLDRPLEHVLERLEIVAAGERLEARRRIAPGHRDVVLDGRFHERPAGHVELPPFDQQTGQRTLAVLSTSPPARAKPGRATPASAGSPPVRRESGGQRRSRGSCLSGQFGIAGTLEECVFRHPLSRRSRQRSSREKLQLESRIG